MPVNVAIGPTSPPLCSFSPAPADVTQATSIDPRELRHEVGNALTAASGHAQRLLRRVPPGLDTRDREALEAIRDSVDRAMHILDRFVASRSARAATGSDLRELMKCAVREVPSDRRDDIDVQVHDSCPLAGGWDDERVIEIIVNLLLNAAKYSASGSPITVDVGRFGPVAQIVVRDKGIGIAAEDQDAIFNGYRTYAARRVAGGSGIGLHVSRRFAEEQGGRLWVTSVRGSGSAFYLALPLETPMPLASTTL